jgi:hypothetical protein
MERYPVINVCVGGHDCGKVDARDLEVIGEAFRMAAIAVRARERGEIVSEMRDGRQLVGVAIDDPRVTFDPATFPVIAEIKRQ